jgi:hypothetical protein
MLSTYGCRFWTTDGAKFNFWYGKEFLRIHIVQTRSGAHPASYSVDTEGCFLDMMQTTRL